MIVPPALPSGGHAEQLKQTSNDFLRLLLETANMRVPTITEARVMGSMKIRSRIRHLPILSLVALQ
jgi:hypothetical protein